MYLPIRPLALTNPYEIICIKQLVMGHVNNSENSLSGRPKLCSAYVIVVVGE